MIILPDSDALHTDSGGFVKDSLGFTTENARKDKGNSEAERDDGGDYPFFTSDFHCASLFLAPGRERP